MIPVLAAESDDASVDVTDSSVGPSEPLQVAVTLSLDDSASEGVVPYVTGEEIVVGAEILDAILSLVTEIRDNTADDSPGGALVSIPIYTTQDLLIPEDRDPEGLTLVSALSSIVGPYTPITYETVTYCGDQAITTTEVVPGLAGIDWAWVASVNLLGLCLLCLFKLMGVVLK